MVTFPNTPDDKTYYGEFKILCPKCRAFFDFIEWKEDGKEIRKINFKGEQEDCDALIITCPNCGYERKV